MVCENLPEPTFLDSYTEMELDRDSLDFSIIKSVSRSGSESYYPPKDIVVDDADKYKQQCSVTDFAELLTKLVKIMEDNRANNKF